MTDMQVTLGDSRPWTKGPWRIVKSETAWANWAQVGPGEHAAITVHGYGYPQGNADAALVALAPEMAEALDGLVDDDGWFIPMRMGERRAEVVCDLVEKLRAIGGNNAG